MKDTEYIERVSIMLYNFQVHRTFADCNNEHFKRLSKLPQSKRFHETYQIFAGCSEAKSPRRILEIIKGQLGINSSDKDFDFLLDFDREALLNWFRERHQQYKSLGCGVYTISCNRTGDVYIGSSLNIQRRLRNHRCHLRNFTHRNARLQALWVKYAEKDFDFQHIKITTDYRNYENFMVDKWRAFMPILNLENNSRKGFNFN